jgi:SecD/SecF fusion protein
MGAIMTIIGYSLNDTIIIFDRIREDVRLKKKLPLEEVVNNALNVTLSRTLITSGTTLLVLLALVFLGGSAIFDLALVMTVGVIFGTISSLFIASPAMLYFHRREERRQAAALSPTRA